MEPVVSRALVIDQARRAVESGQPLHQFQAWPSGSAADQLFQRYVVAMQENSAAAQRIEEGGYA